MADILVILENANQLEFTIYSYPFTNQGGNGRVVWWLCIPVLVCIHLPVLRKRTPDTMDIQLYIGTTLSFGTFAKHNIDKIYLLSLN